MPIIRQSIQRLTNYVRRFLSWLARPFRHLIETKGTQSHSPHSQTAFSMKTPITIQGRWYIFGDNQEPAVGLLKFDPDAGLTLDVQRHRAPDLAQALLGGIGFNVPTVIRGVDAHGAPVTLFGCAVSNYNITAALDDYKIVSACAITGAHFNQFHDAIYNNVRASYSVLDSWLTRSGIVNVPRDGGMPAYSLQNQPDINMTLNDGTTITLTMGLGMQSTNTSMTLSQSQFAQFTAPNPAPLSTLIDGYIFRFGKLLSFLARTEVFVDQIVVPQTGAMPREVEWLSGAPGSAKAKRTLHHQSVLVSFQEIAAQLPTLVVRWFAYYEEMEAILNLYFTATAKSDIPAETRFLLLAQALEAYHNRSDRFVSEIQARDVFRARRDVILGLVADGAERSWLRDKLNFANLKTLAMRLDESIADQQVHVAQFINDTALFAGTVRWTRNYYTHFSEDEENRTAAGRGRIAQGANIIVYSSHMQALLELLFIRDLNLPPVAAGRAVARAQQYQVIGA